MPPGGKVDWEVELVVVIGRRAHRVGDRRGLDHVAGLTRSARTSPSAGCSSPAQPPQFSLGKSLPGFGPIGPWLVTLDELADPDDLELGCEVNGEAVQLSRTSELIFSVPELIAKLSASRAAAARRRHLHRHPVRRRAGPQARRATSPTATS